MTPTAAIRIAARRVQVDHYSADQYRVRYWDAAYNAWVEGDITNRITALHDAHEHKIEIALDLLGVCEAGALANSCTFNAYPKDWRQCVRDEWKADKFAKEQQEA